MPLQERHILTLEEIMFYALWNSRLLLGLKEWADDLTIPRTRSDLPSEWRGRQVLSRQQRLMLCDNSKKIAMRTARKVFKSGNMEMRYWQIPVLYTGNNVREGLFVTPGDVHMTPWMERLRSQKSRIPLLDMLCEGFNTAKGVTSFKTGYIWHHRIEGTSGTGRNMVGLRAYDVIGDEMDYSAWQAHTERRSTAMPDATWMMGGVPRGIKDGNPLYAIMNDPVESQGWSRHRCTSYANPLYASPEAKEELVRSYGGENTVGYITQVKGEDGDAVSSSFPIIPTKSDMDYVFIDLSDDKLATVNWQDLFQALPHIPEDADAIVGGVDVGYSPDPTIIGIAYRYSSVWRLCARIRLVRCTIPLQNKVLHMLNTRALTRPWTCLAIDNIGVGVGLFQSLYEQDDFDYKQVLIPGDLHISVESGLELHRTCKTVLTTLDGSPFCDKCDKFVINPKDREPQRVRNKELLTEQLKEAFHYGHEYLVSDKAGTPFYPRDNSSPLIIPEDRAIMDELSGTTEARTGGLGAVIQYSYPELTGDHNTDMLRMIMRAISFANERLGIDQTVIGGFGGGWSTNPMGSSRNWSTPWRDNTGFGKVLDY